MSDKEKMESAGSIVKDLTTTMDRKVGDVTYRFGADEWSFPTGLKEDQVRKMLSKTYPAVKNSMFKKEQDGSVSILVVEGEKGA